MGPWSHQAGRFHPKVDRSAFHFALLVVTAIGYLLTAAFLLFGRQLEVLRYIYFGFVLMMSMNAIFPHLIASVVLRRYAPGLLTGLVLNLPLGLLLVFYVHSQSVYNLKLIGGFALVSISMILLLRPLFKLGARLWPRN
ncbi:MAG: HXXEE domain-containing protein [Leptospiraceae bacterium]|nr:HXXEE domain-containing protein [Leptospiraceae bacterium]